MKRLYARDLIPRTTVDHSAELAACARSFRAFLHHWTFISEETGELVALDPDHLWAGQSGLVDLLEGGNRVFALKAGKLGFSVLACAYDGWVARFGPRNARIHVSSKDLEGAVALLDQVRFGLEHLPPWMRPEVADDLPGGRTRTSLKLRIAPDDVRTIAAYAATPSASVDRSANLSHVDELAQVEQAERTWSAIYSTLAPGAGCVVVTRGIGLGHWTARLWESAESGTIDLVPFFAAYDLRPGRDQQWREALDGVMPAHEARWFAPETADDALSGEETAQFIPSDVWERCADPSLPPLDLVPQTDHVLGVDLSTKNDFCAVVAVSRHPQHYDHAAIRAVRVWDPRIYGDRMLPEVRRFLLLLIGGGCRNAHPALERDPTCDLCASGDDTSPKFAVVQIAYDRHQAHLMMAELARYKWALEFDQNEERLVADRDMQMRALTGTLWHDNSPILAQHVANARVVYSGDERRMRIQKASPSAKIDAAVAASMAISRAMYLRLRPAPGA